MGEPGPERSGYEFSGGYPWPEAVRRAYDDAGLNRAVRAYGSSSRRRKRLRGSVGLDPGR